VPKAREARSPAKVVMPVARDSVMVEPLARADVRVAVSRKGGRVSPATVLLKLTVPVPDGSITEAEFLRDVLERQLLDDDCAEHFIASLHGMVGTEKEAFLIVSRHDRLPAKCH